MHLGYTNYSSLFFLSQFNLYTIVLLLVLGCLLDKFNFNFFNKKTTANLNLSFSWSNLFFIVLPFIAAMLLLLLTLRTEESLSTVGDIVFSTLSIKWLILIYFIGFSLFFSLFFLTNRISFFSIEFFFTVLLLIQVWTWVSLSTNWLTVLLFFEISALSLLLFCAYTFNINNSFVYNKYKVQENNLNTEFNFLRFFIFFLWLSVVATFIFFWVLAFNYSFWLGLDMHFIFLLNIYVWGSNSTLSFLSKIILGLLGLGFIFKLILIPLQSIILSLYSAAPFKLILLYFSFYYIFFLFISFFSFSSVFYFFWSGWSFFILFLSLFLLLFFITNLAIDADFRQIFVISSIVNLTLLLLTIV